jgi:hypothetical protein
VVGGGGTARSCEVKVQCEFRVGNLLVLGMVVILLRRVDDVELLAAAGGESQEGWFGAN